MKLLHCHACGDVVRVYGEWRACHCGKSSARYVDDAIAVIRGPARVLGIDTGALMRESSGEWRESERVSRST